MHGQKPLWAPGAWQEYFSAAWLLAGCLQVHFSRAMAGETFAAWPRPATFELPFRELLLVTVPHSFCTRGAYHAPRASSSSYSGTHTCRFPNVRMDYGCTGFSGCSLTGRSLPFSVRFYPCNYNLLQQGLGARRNCLDANKYDDFPGFSAPYLTASCIVATSSGISMRMTVPSPRRLWMSSRKSVP
jgi:hypothetical protein